MSTPETPLDALRERLAQPDPAAQERAARFIAELRERLGATDETTPEATDDAQGLPARPPA